LLSLETAPFFFNLLSSDTVAFFVRLLSLDMTFSFRLVECPSELVAASHCELMQINHQPLIGHNVIERIVRLF
jgi:hypothetical protein